MRMSESCIKDEQETHCIFLCCADLLNSESIVKRTAAGEVLLNVLLRRAQHEDRGCYRS